MFLWHSPLYYVTNVCRSSCKLGLGAALSLIHDAFRSRLLCEAYTWRGSNEEPPRVQAQLHILNHVSRITRRNGARCVWKGATCAVCSRAHGSGVYRILYLLQLVRVNLSTSGLPYILSIWFCVDTVQNSVVIEYICVLHCLIFLCSRPLLI